MSAYVVTKSTSDQSQTVNDLSGSQGNFNIGESLNLEKGAVFSVETTDQGAIDAGKEIGLEALGIGRDLFSQANDTVATATQSVERIASGQQQFASQVNDSIGGLAKAFQSDGASDDRKMVIWLGVGAFVVTGVVIVAVSMAGGKK
jgi:hypothetical protein